MWRSFLSLLIAGLAAGNSTFLPTEPTELGIGGYNITYAYHALYFSAAAYCTKEQILDWDCGEPCKWHPGFKPVAVYTFELKGETPQVFTGYSDAAKKFIVSFQGTQGTTQLLSELWASGQTAAELAPGHTYNVEKYFWEAYDGLQNIRQQIHHDAKKHALSDYDFFITGHSLGGALASICALDLVLSGITTPEKIMLYTMGQPRVGDSEYAKAFDKYVPQSYRIVHSDDLVVHIPPEWLFGYTYEHTSQEIWYNQDFTNYTECGPNDDPNCANSVWFYDWSIDDHLEYFNVHVGGSCAPTNSTVSI